MMAGAKKHSYPRSIPNLTTWNSVFVQVQKTKRSYKSVTAFQRALVLIVSLKQLFSSHSVPTSHSQLLAACTHMYIHPHSHFICGGNMYSFCLSLSFVVNVSFSLSDRYSPYLKFRTNECSSEQACNYAVRRFWLVLASFTHVPRQKYIHVLHVHVVYYSSYRIFRLYSCIHLHS